jgi:hypothetical protein
VFVNPGRRSIRRRPLAAERRCIVAARLVTPARLRDVSIEEDAVRHVREHAVTLTDGRQSTVCGISSGICAFTVAWKHTNHFDACQCCGRSASRQPQLSVSVRTTPSKPLRVFLQSERTMRDAVRRLAAREQDHGERARIRRL